MLPGFGDTDSDFHDHGFEQAIDARNLPVDTIAVSATIGYYMRETLLERMRTDVLDPARAQGYEQIWIVGISMGGIGTLLVAKDQATRHRELAGIVLLAPYLGTDDVQKEVANAGGLAKWQPSAPRPDEEYSRGVWRWLKTATEQPQSSPAIYLGAGDADRRSAGYDALAAALPHSHVFHTPGPHDWEPWGVMWAKFLDSSDLRARCSTL
jgi:pimeloyl-ACP methyl ester carboxylesterase